MGLDVTHDCWHGAYSAFNRFRCDVAAAVGLPLKAHSWETCEWWQPDWEFDEATLQGEWESPPDDPIMLLLVHSDCDGVIKVEHAAHLANRLEQLLPLLPNEGAGHLSSGGSKAAAERFIAGLRLAADAGEEVEFR